MEYTEILHFWCAINKEGNSNTHSVTISDIRFATVELHHFAPAYLASRKFCSIGSDGQQLLAKWTTDSLISRRVELSRVFRNIFGPLLSQKKNKNHSVQANNKGRKQARLPLAVWFGYRCSRACCIESAERSEYTYVHWAFGPISQRAITTAVVSAI